jgi:hypothetical protein
MIEVGDFILNRLVMVKASATCRNAHDVQSPALRRRDAVSMMPRFTFAAVGHNEAATLPLALGYARDAAQPGDHVWFVDSASDDGSAEVAREHGAAVVAAPLGKGRAMATAIDLCDDDFICFFDADMLETEHNIPRVLRDAAVASEIDMLVGTYDEPGRRRTVTSAIYFPLVRTLFPEVLEADIVPALGGFRVLRVGLPLGPFPPGYGVETWLNVQVTLMGGRVASCPVGWFRGKLRNYTNMPAMATDVAEALLDLGEAHGRLSEAARPAWEAWVAEAVELIGGQPLPGADDRAFLDDLARVSARALPSPR